MERRQPRPGATVHASPPDWHRGLVIRSAIIETVLRVGLTGGLASGKSFIGRALESLGCHVIRMDELGRQALDPASVAYFQVLAEFQAEVALLNPDGSINRRALGAYVFADVDRLARLNAIVHPAARAEEQALANAYFAQNPHGIVVTEAAILIETGRYVDYDRLIVAVCRPEQQLKRAIERGGLGWEEASQRMSRQFSLEEKRKYAHFVIDTSGSEEQTLTQAHSVYQSLLSLNR